MEPEGRSITELLDGMGRGGGSGSIISDIGLVLGDETGLVLGKTSGVGRTSQSSGISKQHEVIGREEGCSRAETRTGAGSVTLKSISHSRLSNSTKLPLGQTCDRLTHLVRLTGIGSGSASAVGSGSGSLVGNGSDSR